METILCLDDFTCGLSGAIETLRKHRYRVVVADNVSAALQIAADTPIDAVILNCRKEAENHNVVVALRILRPRAAFIMYSGYCGAPCNQLQLADACVEKGETASTLLKTLQAVLCQAKYGFCRSVTA